MGAVIRSLRAEASLSQEELAARCGLHRTYIGSIERGEKTITIETAQKLSRAFGVTLTQLFERLEKLS
jgi:transcriptional regulator with XRE-family HTH domain